MNVEEEKRRRRHTTHICMNAHARTETDTHARTYTQAHTRTQPHTLLILFIIIIVAYSSSEAKSGSSAYCPQWFRRSLKERSLSWDVFKKGTTVKIPIHFMIELR